MIPMMVLRIGSDVCYFRHRKASQDWGLKGGTGFTARRLSKEDWFSIFNFLFSFFISGRRMDGKFCFCLGINIKI